MFATSYVETSNIQSFYTKENIALLIKQKREEENLNAIQASQLMNVPLTQYTKIEHGKKEEMSRKELEAIAKFLNISYKELTTTYTYVCPYVH